MFRNFEKDLDRRMTPLSKMTRDLTSHNDLNALQKKQQALTRDSSASKGQYYSGQVADDRN